MLFITFLIATGASVMLYRNWVDSYHEEVLNPQLNRQLKVVKSAIDLFAFSRTNKANHHVNDAAKLLLAFDEPDLKKRRNRVHDELNVLHRIKDGIKTAAVVAAVDMKGKAFVRADNPNWQADWSKLKPVQMALKGTASHGFVMFQNKPHIVLAVPVIKQALLTPPKKDEDDEDEAKGKKKKVAKRKCPAGRRYACWRPCAKRNKKRKCIRYARKKRCGCIRIRRRRKKTGMVAPKVVKVRRAQSAPDDKATPKAKKKPEKRAKQLGVIVLGYLLDNRLALNLKSSAGSDIAFVSGKGNLLGATVQGRLRDSLAKALKANTSKKGKASKMVDGVRTLSLGGKYPHIAARSKIKRLTGTELVVLQPMKSIYELFEGYVMWLGTLGGLTFLLSLVLLFPFVSRFRRDLEAIEDGILETYNTGNLKVQFDPRSADLLGPLAASLNKLYAQLRGEPDEEDDELKRSGDWDLDGLGVDERIVSGTFPVPQEIHEEPAEQPVEEPPAAEEAAEEAAAEEPNPQDWIETLLANPDAHYAEVFVRYVNAKQELGEDTSKLNEERFIQKLHKNAEACMTQFEDCRGVLFDISVKDNKVILKPQLIPKE